MTLPAANPPRFSQCSKILRVLSDGRPHSAAEIHHLCGFSRLNSRISELRKRGHVIDCDRDRTKSGPEAYVYTLLHDARSLGERETEPTHQPPERKPGDFAHGGEVAQLPLTEAPGLSGRGTIGSASEPVSPGDAGVVDNRAPLPESADSVLSERGLCYSPPVAQRVGEHLGRVHVGLLGAGPANPRSDNTGLPPSAGGVLPSPPPPAHPQQLALATWWERNEGSVRVDV